MTHISPLILSQGTVYQSWINDIFFKSTISGGASSLMSTCKTQNAFKLTLLHWNLIRCRYELFILLSWKGQICNDNNTSLNIIHGDIRHMFRRFWVCGRQEIRIRHYSFSYVWPWKRQGCHNTQILRVHVGIIIISIIQWRLQSGKSTHRNNCDFKTPCNITST